MKCPNCGANADSSETTCRYCKADLAIRACPRCFGKLFLGTKFCQQCGAKSEEPASALPDGNAAPRYCPRCRGGGQVRLESQLAREVMLDTCPDCSGLYVDNDLLERILAERRYQSTDAKTVDAAASASAQQHPQAAQNASTQNTPFYVKCPDCEGNMARRLFAPRAGVIVDVCKHHGTWLDPSELGQLITFVQRGGLDDSGPTTNFNTSALRRAASTPPSPEVRRANTTRSSLSDANVFEEVVDTLFKLLR